MRRNLILAILAVLVLVILSLLSNPFTTQNTSRMLLSPTLNAPFGTDTLGRNALLLALAGLKQSFLIAVLAVLIGASFGTLVGIIAGRLFHKPADIVLGHLQDVIFAFPALISAMLLTALTDSSNINWLKDLRQSGMIAMFAIALFNIPVFARILRARAALLWQMPYVAAARLNKQSDTLIALRHIFPNLMAPLLVHSATQLAMALIAEAGLSFIGLGVQPPLASLGRQLAASQSFITIAPNLLLAPALILITLTALLVFIGDQLSKYMDELGL